QVLPAFLGDLVDLLAAFFGQRARIAEILEHRQGRVNGLRTRRIHPPEPLLDLLDDLVTVSRLFIEQTKDHELQVTLVEHPPTTKRTTPRLAASTPERAGIEPEILRSHPESPREPRPAVPVVHRPDPPAAISPARRHLAPTIVLAIYLLTQSYIERYIGARPA